MKRLLTCLSVFTVICVVATPKDVSAHVFVKDSSNSKGAIIHISPGDDPVVGQGSTIFMTVKDNINLNDYGAQLEITTDDNVLTPRVIKLERKDNTYSADYVFPRVGLYNLRYTFSPAANAQARSAITFEYKQRVERSALSKSEKSNSRWAEAIRIFSIAGLLLVSALGYNRWRNRAS